MAEFDGDISDSEFLAAVTAIEKQTSISSYFKAGKAGVSSAAPKKRRRALDNLDELSDTEIGFRLQKQRKKSVRRRNQRQQKGKEQAKLERQKVWDDNLQRFVWGTAEEVASWSRNKTRGSTLLGVVLDAINERGSKLAVLKSVEEDFVPKDYSATHADHRLSVERQREKYLEIRRRGRSTTPPWIEVGDDDRHKFRKLFHFGSGLRSYRHYALKEDLLKPFEGDLDYLFESTTVSGDEFSLDVLEEQELLCLCSQSDRQHEPKEHHRGDKVDMAKLFSFMSK